MRGRRNPVAKALVKLKPKVVKMKTRYVRKARTEKTMEGRHENQFCRS